MLHGLPSKLGRYARLGQGEDRIDKAGPRLESVKTPGVAFDTQQRTFALQTTGVARQ